MLFKYKDDLVFFTFNYFSSIYMALIFAVATGFSMLLICIFFLKQAEIKKFQQIALWLLPLSLKNRLEI